MRGITVGEEMKPWRQVASIDESTPCGERAKRFLTSGASRLPVVDRKGRVTGIVAAVDHFARPAAATADMLRPVLLLPPSVSALDAIGRMRRERVQMAVVGDRLDRPLGIVSIKDLVEPLVGDLAAW
jgi:CBS domain containing-hemolysin-like protein